MTTKPTRIVMRRIYVGLVAVAASGATLVAQATPTLPPCTGQGRPRSRRAA